MFDIGLDFSRFSLSEDDFSCYSIKHGINHTYRVMIHCISLGGKLKNIQSTRRSFCAAFIHDLARRHDGYCTKHGLWAVQEKLPQFSGMFHSMGLSEDDFEAIELAVVNHSERNEISDRHLYYTTVALLKDADALDRVRLGEDNLNPKFFRLDESQHLIPFAKRLFEQTKDRKYKSFADFFSENKKLET
ncbi:MAG: hypothetical protein KAT48_14260 [Bacteroidales bacterium]|nr:hypothetical protein [Bacteroidales bacterium]